MKIVAISGSTQANSQSLKLAKYLQARLETKQATANLVDLHKLNLPILGSADKSWQPAWQTAEKKLAAADGYVFVVPEWNGTAAPGLRNMLLYTAGQTLAHKPVMVVGVSAGRGGARPIMDVRAAGHKDTRYLIIPESLIVSQCHEVFNDQNFDKDAPDIYLKQRADYSLSLLLEYARALQSVRQSKVIDHEAYPFGV